MIRRLSLLASACALLLAAPAQAGTTAKVETGRLAGTASDGVTSFKNIPYARPPVGALRWAPPQPAKAWAGIRDATRYGPLCMQKLSKDNGVGPGPASEDCLSVNVFTPNLKPAKPAPVMVWVHGGGFVNGSGTADLYDGGALARQGVVVVTLNYRLGRFGFFAHPALTHEAKGQPLANYGLMDQVAALKWVRRNIKAFGGNPRNVTLFGESAGGISVNQLMLIGEARGLFQKAVVESGLGHDRMMTLPEAEKAGVSVAEKLGVPSSAADPLKALRAVSADALLALGDPEINKGEAPIQDGVYVRSSPDKAFAAGAEAKVPYLVGSNALEFPGAFAARLRDILPLDPASKPALIAAYGSEDAYQERVVTDALFGEPARTLARMHAQHGLPTWLYRFSILSAGAPPTLKGAPHASDRQYVFKTLNASPWPTDARDARLAEDVSAYWVNFAKTGNPNRAGLKSWPRYGAGDRLINFTNDGPVVITTPDAKVLDAISKARLP